VRAVTHTGRSTVGGIAQRLAVFGAAEIRQLVLLPKRPYIQRVEVWRIKTHVYLVNNTVEGCYVVLHHAAVVRAETVPDHRNIGRRMWRTSACRKFTTYGDFIAPG
jgi:hypothetical protein